MICKIIDFGTAIPVGEKDKVKVPGTPSWTAPEIFQGEPYTEKADVFSLAISNHFLLSL